MPSLPPVVNDGLFPAVRTAINSGLSVLSDIERWGLLRNGAFEFWQRGTSFNLDASPDFYIADGWRWQNNCSINPTGTITRETFTVGQTEVPGDPKYYCRLNFTSTGAVGPSGYVVLDTPVANVAIQSGETVTLSFWTRTSFSTKAIYITLLQHFGTGGSPSANVPITAQNITVFSNWRKYTLTFTMPSVAGKTLGTNGTDCLVLRFWFGAGSTIATSNLLAGTLTPSILAIDLASIKLERGSYASPFIMHDAIYRLFYENYCRQFYQNYTNYIISTNTANASVYYFSLPFAPAMYRTPTVTLGFVNGAFTGLTASGFLNSQMVAFFATASATSATNFLHCNVTMSAEIW